MFLLGYFPLVFVVLFAILQERQQFTEAGCCCCCKPCCCGCTCVGPCQCCNPPLLIKLPRTCPCCCKCCCCCCKPCCCCCGGGGRRRRSIAMLQNVLPESQLGPKRVLRDVPHAADAHAHPSLPKPSSPLGQDLCKCEEPTKTAERSRARRMAVLFDKERKL